MNLQKSATLEAEAIFSPFFANFVDAQPTKSANFQNQILFFQFSVFSAEVATHLFV